MYILIQMYQYMCAQLEKNQISHVSASKIYIYIRFNNLYLSQSQSLWGRGAVEFQKWCVLFYQGYTMGFLPQPHGATCTKQQHCSMACSWGRVVFFWLTHSFMTCAPNRALSSCFPPQVHLPFVFLRLANLTLPNQNQTSMLHHVIILTHIKNQKKREMAYEPL